MLEGTVTGTIMPVPLVCSCPCLILPRHVNALNTAATYIQRCPCHVGAASFPAVVHRSS